jgi:hypothetical protein
MQYGSKVCQLSSTFDPGFIHKKTKTLFSITMIIHLEGFSAEGLLFLPLEPLLVLDTPLAGEILDTMLVVL